MLNQNKDYFYFWTKILVAGLLEDSSFFFFLSLSGIPKIVNIKNTKQKYPMSTQNIAKNNTQKKIKNTKIQIKCVGGRGIFYLLCLISNTLPQLEQSSLFPSTVLHHRLLLQTTCYNHLHLLLHLISRKEKQKQQEARNPP